MKNILEIWLLYNNQIIEKYKNEEHFNKSVIENPIFFYNKKLQLLKWDKIFISDEISNDLIKTFEKMNLKNMNNIWIIEMICSYNQEWNENEEFNDIYYIK